MKKTILTSLILIAVVSCQSNKKEESAKTDDSVKAEQVKTIPVTEENYAHAETARNFRNWGRLGANDSIFHMRELPPRGKEAPTVQMNDDTFYSMVIAETIDGSVQFSIPETDVYMAVQVVNEGGHGQHYVVEPGEYNLPVESKFAILIYRTGLEKGFEAAHRAQDKINTDNLKFGTYKLPNYDYEEVEEWTKRLTAETSGTAFKYTFPRSSKEITDRHQWNLENANGWGGSSPEANVSNLYTNSIQFDGDKSYSTTFYDPKSKYFTSFTAYDKERYLMEGVEHISSHTWTPNDDGTITITFNGGDNALNNIDTKGQDFGFTVRYYGVNQKVIDGEIAPEKTVEEIK